MKNKFFACIVTGLLMFAGFSQAENEAIFNQSTKTLVIPKVLIGSAYYTMDMKYKGEGLDFEIIDYAKIEPEAHIETVDIQILESFPVPVNVVAKGYFADGCERIDNIYSEKSDNVFTIIITTKSVGEVCTAALVPFEEIIPLVVNGLKAGFYNVFINGIKSSFELTIDN